MVPAKDLESETRPEEEDVGNKETAKFYDEKHHGSDTSCFSSTSDSISTPSSSCHHLSCNEDSLFRITDISSLSSADVSDSPEETIVASETDHPRDFSRPVNMTEKNIYRFAQNRLKSFQDNSWPLEDVAAEELAEAGFFVRSERKHPDETECIFCRLKIFHWTPDMDPLVVHNQRSPHCDFIMGYSVDNIPLDGKAASDPIRGINRRTDFREPDVCGSSPTGSGMSSPGVSLPFLPASSIITADDHRAASFPSFVTFESRLNTFPSDWVEKTCPVMASRLAEAGFFYRGPTTGDGSVVVHDCVWCFHCGIPVGQWEATDDPWFEHNKISQQKAKDCYFLRLNYDHYMSRNEEATASATLEETPKTKEKTNEVVTGTSTKSLDLSSVGKALASFASNFESSQPSSSDQSRCKVCWTRDIEMLFLPCRHANCCGECATAVTKCPSCRASIEGSVRIYLS